MKKAIESERLAAVSSSWVVGRATVRHALVLRSLNMVTKLIGF